jgi:bifunctional non-homologous end joining protein LigD
VPAARNRDWLKVKNVLRQEFVIAGWLPQKGRRIELGALLVGHYEGDDLRFAGKVGTGFNREQARQLVERLKPLARSGSPFAGRQPEKGANFVDPELVAEVDYGSMTRDGMLRHPSYKGLRTDKEPEEVVLERPEDPSAAPFDVTALKSSSRGVIVEVEGRELKLTNLDKVLYPKPGFTKRQVIDYYARIAPVLAPHLAGRPLTLKRYPDGVEGKHFFEKKCPSHRPEWIETATVPSERRGEIRFCLIGDLPGLVWIANLADLELHPSLSLAADLDHPTTLAFDLDPGPGTGLLECCEVGLWINGMLERLGIRCFPKVSGKKGLHLFAPLGGTADYERTKSFARGVAETLEARFPDRVTSNMAKSRRKRRVLVDWSQNDRHKTTLAPYSLRATERPQVSMPLGWEELEAAVGEKTSSSLVFGPEEALARVDELGDLFAPILSMRQEIPG